MKLIKENYIEYWTNLSYLLDSGFTIQDALIINNDQTSIELLNNNCFFEEKINSQHNFFYNHLKFLINHTSLVLAVKYSLAIFHFRRNLINKILEKISYSIFILTASLVLLCFFNFKIKNQITSSFELSTQSNINISDLLLNILLIILALFIITILVSIVIYKLSNLKIKFKFYKLLTRIPIIRLYYSIIFCYYFYYLSNSGLSSKKIIELLLEIKTDYYLIFTIQEIHQGLNQGISFQSLIINCQSLDPKIKNILKLNFNSNNNISLQDIINGQIKILISKIIKFTSIINILAYLIIFLICNSIYSCLLSPLEMIEEL